MRIKTKKVYNIRDFGFIKVLEEKEETIIEERKAKKIINALTKKFSWLGWISIVGGLFVVITTKNNLLVFINGVSMGIVIMTFIWQIADEFKN